MLDINLWDPQAFDIHDITVDSEFLKARDYHVWFENTTELLEYFQSEFDTVTLTENKSLVFSMIINPKSKKQKDFIFSTAPRVRSHQAR